MPTGTKAQSVVEELCSQGPRRTGSDAERRIANSLAERLRAAGRRVVIEPTYVHPQWPAVHFLHAAIALAASLLAGVAPAVSFALALFAATSLYLDLSGRAYLLRSLFFRRASQNVISPPLGESERPRVILTAHYDSALTGAAYNDWAVNGFERLRRLWPARTSPSAVLFWSIALLLPALGLRMAGIDAGWVSVLQLPQTTVLLVAAFMLAEIGLSPPSPGANDNASGVAAALEAVERLADDPPEALDVQVVLAGGGETTREGLRSFLRSHRRELREAPAWLIDLDSVGRGEPRFAAAEVPAVLQRLDPELIALCEALCEGVEGCERLDLGPTGAASLAASRGIAAIALTAREGAELIPADHHTPEDIPDAVEPEAISTAVGLAADLVRLLDRQAAREAGAGQR